MQRMGIEYVGEDKSFTKTNDKFQKGLKNSTKAADSASKGIVSRLTSIGSGVGSMVAKFGLIGQGVQMLGRLTSGIQAFIGEAGMIPGVASSFSALGGSIEDMRRGSLGMVQDVDLMKSFNSAAQLVSVDFAQKLPDAMGYLTKVSASTGESMDYMIDSLVKGVGRLSPMILDNLGIQVNLTEANEAYAASIGVSADELTKSQQQTAMMNMVMEKLATNTKQMTGLEDSAAQQMASLGVTIQNLKNDIGVELLPVMSAFMGPLGELAADLAPSVVSAVHNIVGVLVDRLVPAIQTAFGVLSTLIVTIRNVPRAVKGAISQFEKFGAGAGVGYLLRTLGVPDDLRRRGVELAAAAEEVVLMIISRVREIVGSAQGLAANVMGTAEDNGVYGLLRMLGLPAAEALNIEGYVNAVVGAVQTAFANAKALFLSGSAAGGTEATGVVEGGPLGGILAMLGINSEVSALIEPITALAKEVIDLVRTTFTNVLGSATGEEGSGGLLASLLGVATLGGRIKEMLITGLADVGTTMLEVLGDMFPDLQPILDEWVLPVWEVITTVIDSFFELKHAVMDAITEAFGQTDILDTFRSIFDSVLLVVQSVIPPILDLAKAVIPLIGAAIAAAIPIVQRIIEVFSHIVADVFPSVVGAVTAVVNAVTANMPLIRDIITGVLDVIEAVWNKVWPRLEVVVSAFTNNIGTWINGALLIIQGVVNVVKGILTGDWAGAWEGAKQVVGGVITTISASLSTFLDLVGGLLGNAADTIGSIAKSLGIDVVQGMMDGLSEKAGELVEKAKSVVGDAIQGAKNLLGISSPSKVFEGIGVDTILGMVKGIDDSESKLIQSVTKSVSRVIDSFKKLLELTSQFGTNGPAALPDMTQFMRSYKDFVQGVSTSMGELENTLGYERIKKLAKVARRFSEIFEGLSGLGSFEIKLFDTSKIAQWGEQTRQLAVELVDTLLALEDTIGNTDIQQAVKVSGRISGITSFVTDAIDAIVALDEYTNVESLTASITNLSDRLHEIIPVLVNVANHYNRFALEAASDILTAAEGMVGFVSTAIDAITALAEYEHQEGVGGAVERLAWDMEAIVDKLEGLSKLFDLEGLEAAEKIFDAMAGIVSIVSSGVEALTSLFEYETQFGLAERMDNFALDLLDLVISLEGIQTALDLDALESAKKIFAAATSIVGIVQPGLEAIAGLFEYETEIGLTERFDNFALDLLDLVSSLEGLQISFDAEALTSAKGIFESVEVIVGVVEPAIDALMALTDYTRGEGFAQAFVNFQTDFLRLVWALDNIANNPEWGLATLGLESAEKVLGSAKSIVEVVEPAIEALTSLAKYERSKGLVKSIGDFGDDMETVVTGLGGLADRFTEEGIAKAEAFKDAATLMKETIEEGFGVIEGAASGGSGGILETLRVFANTVMHHLGQIEERTRDQTANLLQAFTDIRYPLRTVLGDLADAFYELTAAINSVPENPPWYLIAHSPPPLARALADVRDETLSLQSTLKGGLGLQALPMQAQPQVGGSSTVYNVSINMGGQTINNGMDATQLALQVQRIINDNLRGS